MRRKLSSIEQMVDINIVCVVNLEGSFTLDRLRSALSRVQRKHPALRSLIREEQDGLYYEADCAPEIPLRIVARVSEDNCRNELQTELTTVFTYDQPQLRAVWLRSERENDLLLTTTHRICDAMSIFTIAREVLLSSHSDQELIPYQPITTRDIIGDYQPPKPWKSKLAACLVNGLLGRIPASRRAPENNEDYLEWKADRALSDALKQRCRAEGVSVHAALTVTLERALFAVFGKKKFPKWIVSPVDLRRERFAALKSDAVFSGAGNIKISTQSPDGDFWARARAINEEIRREVNQEILDIPSRFHFLEMIRPLSIGQVQLSVQLVDLIVQLGDALNFNGSWNRFGLSNLGNIAVGDNDAPFQVKDLHLYIHSFNFRIFGLVPYTFNGEMRFYYVSDKKWQRRCPAHALKRVFMDLLELETFMVDNGVNEVFHSFVALAK